MACGKGNVQLSPTDQKIGKAIEHEYLSTEQIVKKTGLPMFKVRSGIRTLKDNNLIIEKDEKFKINKEA